MTNQQHPIIPPPELVEEWANAAAHEFDIAKFAARWGADQELEACVKWIAYHPPVPDDLRTARRFKSPSLKELALAALAAADGADHPVVCTVITADQHAIIRQALEQLDD